MDILKIIGQQDSKQLFEVMPVIDKIIDEDYERAKLHKSKCGLRYIAGSAYLLGYMDGKRAERKRRKKK